MRRIQKEYPPIRPDGDGRRGHYDLVILDEPAMTEVNWWNHRHKDEGTLEIPVGPAVALEMGVNKGLTADAEGTEGRLNEPEKEMRRLVNPKNRVGWGLVLYLYRYAPFQHETMASIVQSLKKKADRIGPVNVTLIAVGVGEGDDFTERAFYDLQVRAGKVTMDQGDFASGL